jgi:hypothetical protein
MLRMLRDPLLTPALDAGEVGLGEINGHPARLLVDIGEVVEQGLHWDCGLGGDRVNGVAPAVEQPRVLNLVSGVGDGRSTRGRRLRPRRGRAPRVQR